MAYTRYTVEDTNVRDGPGKRPIAIDSTGRINIVYMITEAPGWLRVMCSYSDTGGSNWTDSQVIQSPDFGSSPNACVVGDFLNIGYMGGIERSESGRAKYITGHPALSWSAPIYIPASEGLATISGIHCSGNNTVYFPFTEGGNVKVRSLSGGIWNIEEVLGSGQGCAITSQYNGGLYIAHAVWHSGTKLYHSYYTGDGWSAPSLIYTFGNAAANGDASLATDSNDTIHLVYHEFIGGQWYIRYRSLPLGGSWSSAVTVQATGYGRSPSIGVNNSNCVTVAWNRYGGSDIYVRHTVDNGINWSAQERVATFGARPQLLENSPDNLTAHMTATVNITPRTQYYWNITTPQGPVGVAGGSYGFIM